MKQLLRITYDESDYTYQILNEMPINNTTTEIHISMKGEQYSLIRDDNRKWISKETDNKLDPGLIQAIGRTVALRYRL
ncbi:hypothetical protein [Rubrolithibacter danxiaensis]|uniref:hypothetical protein n=1 Tax=Rubrolithibacter danxiaensis TaxID=3390805 RepID=UPI003BF91B9C